MIVVKRRSRLLQVIISRVLQSALGLVGASFIIFCLLTLLPGTAAVALLPDDATKQQVAQLSQRLGLNKPFFVQYFDWSKNALTGNLGESLTSNQPVSTILAERLPVTVELVVLAFIISLAVAVPVAVLAAYRPGKSIDRLSTLAGMVGLSVPVFVLGLILILLLAVHFHVFPSQGYVPMGTSIGQNLRAMLLPAVTIAFPLFCHYTRILRADIIDQLNSGEYIVTARAKGLGELRVLIRHALFNSLFTTLTFVGLNLGTMIGSTVVVESVFDIPGIGQELITAIEGRDIQVVTAIVLVLALAVIAANLVTDLLIAALDPRVSHGRVNG
jgi:peptide/nickel transport system permease protein